MHYRQLNDSEITALVDQGCSAADWRKVQVAQRFRHERVRNTRFSGTVRLGAFERTVQFAGGIERPCGVYSSTLHNCSIGDNAYVVDVRRMANYTLKEDVVVENVNELVVSGESGFGNGTRIHVLNEAGGRPLILFDRLSAQIAYLLVLYRYQPELIESLEALIEEYVKTRVSGRGTLGRGCRVDNCTRITNVEIGPRTEVSGVLTLTEGTIRSCAEDPARVGEGTVASHFILLSGARVGSGVFLDSCFVGQGVRLDKQFSAKDSAFFANCEGYHGEVVSVFAGPYTVTHHKSTLLIAGMFSFFNAGSGTNQSNHRYKLGPVHQGVLERGCKTGSSSYLLWPCRIGPFTTVTGNHYANFDSGIFPFSNIAEKEGKSVLTPAVNLLNVGSRRDSGKWPARDRRKDPDKLDLIQFKLFNPFTVGRMLKGRDRLHALSEEASREREMVIYEGIHIRRLMMKSTARYYEMGIKVFLGGCLLERLEGLKTEVAWEDAKAALRPIDTEPSDWVDLFGLLAPERRVAKLVQDLIDETIDSLESLNNRFKAMHDSYEEEEWAWCLSLIESRMGIGLGHMKPENLASVVEDWRENSNKLNNMILKDAAREFDLLSHIGFGLDGSREEKKEDFQAVRGRPEENPFIQQIEEESQAVEKRASRVLKWLERL